MQEVLKYPCSDDTDYENASSTVRANLCVKDIKKANKALCQNEPFGNNAILELRVKDFHPNQIDIDCLSYELFDTKRKTQKSCPDPSVCKNCIHHIRWLYRVDDKGIKMEGYYLNDPEGLESDLHITRSECAKETGSYAIVTTLPLTCGDLVVFLQEITSESDRCSK